MKWKLVNVTKDGAFNKYKNDNEERLHYQSEKGDKVEFYSHPTEPFTYEGKESKKGNLNKVLNAYIEAASKQHSFPGGYDEAIKVLTV